MFEMQKGGPLKYSVQVRGVAVCVRCVGRPCNASSASRGVEGEGCGAADGVRGACKARRTLSSHNATSLTSQIARFARL